MTLIPLLVLQSPVTLKEACASSFPTDRWVYARTPEKFDPRQRFASVAELSKRLGFVARFDKRSSAGFAWSPLALFPNFVPTESDRLGLRAAEGLGKMAPLLGDKADRFFGRTGGTGLDVAGGASFRELGAAGKQVIDAMVTGSEAIKEKDDARVSLSYNTFVTFTASDGRTESFPLKAARDGGRVPKPPAHKGNPDDERVPAGLREGLARFAPILPREGVLVSLKTLSESMSQASGLKICVDRRVENDRLYWRKGAVSRVSLADQAYGVACAMDMYWRKVGEVYFLAISPQDPRVYALKRFQRRTALATGKFMSNLAGLGLMPDGLSVENLYEDPRSLSAIRNDELQGIAACVRFPNPAEEARFRAVLNDPGFRKGTMRYQGICFATIASSEAKAVAGGTVVRLGGDD